MCQKQKNFPELNDSYLQSLESVDYILLKALVKEGAINSSPCRARQAR